MTNKLIWYLFDNALDRWSPYISRLLPTFMQRKSTIIEINTMSTTAQIAQTPPSSPNTPPAAATPAVSEAAAASAATPTAAQTAAAPPAETPDAASAETPATTKRKRGRKPRPPPTPAERRAKAAERRDKFIHPTSPKRIQPQRDAHDAARQLMQDGEHLTTVRKSGQKGNRSHHAIGCKYFYIVMLHSLPIIMIAKMRLELREQYHASRDCQAPWSKKAFIRTIREIEHHDVVCSGIFADSFPDKLPLGWSKGAVTAIEEAAELYMIEVITIHRFCIVF